MNEQQIFEAVFKATGVSDFQKAAANAQQAMKDLDKVGGKLKGIGKGMMKSVTAPIVAMGTGVMMVGKEYEASMSQVAAISGATGKDLDKLKETAREMGATTRYSASESADALGYMALAGWDVEQMTSALPGVLNLATAGAMDLALASDIVTDTMSMFGMEATEAGRASDIFAAAQSKSNTNVEQLSEALLNAGPAAAAAGADLEQTSAILGIFANQGVKGGRAGTALNAMFRDIKASAEDGAIAIGEHSVSVYDANGSMRAMGDIMADVEKATSGMTTEQRDSALADVFKQQSLSGVNLLLAEGSDALKDLENDIYNSDGVAQNMADTMDDNLNGALANMKSALEEVALGFYDMAGGPMTTIIKKITELFQWFGNLSDGAKQWIGIVALVVAALGPLIWLVGSLATGIAGIPAILALLAGPVGAVIAGIVAVVAIGALLIANWESIKETIKGVFEAIFPDFDLFKNKIEMIWHSIKEAFSEGNMEQVGEMFKYMFSLIFQKIEEALPVLMQKGLEIVTNIIEGITTKIPEWLAKGLEIMVLLADVLADFIPKLIRLGADFVISLLKGLSEKIPEWIKMGVDMVIKMAQTLGDNLPKIIQKGGELLAGAAKGFRDKFPEIVAAALEMIAKMLGAIAESLPRLVVAGMELIVKLAIGLVRAIPNVLRAMRDITVGITDAVSNISLLDAGKAIISGFVRGLKSAWKAGKSFVSGIGGWIQRNKGPISYDKKLLIGAGEAIIGGLNKGLEDTFPDVQKTVKGIAGAINETLVGNPTIDINGSVARSNASVNRAVSHQISDMTVNSQPAYINVNIGGQNFRGFVENISNEQGRITDLELQF